jgi:flap endonuclease-1
MGVKITSLIERRHIELEYLAGKKIAIDAYNWIYQFLSTIRQADGTPLQTSGGETTSHLSGLFYRTTRLMKMGIKPVYVFDGRPPEFKYVLKQRAEKKQEARAKWRTALEAGDMEAAKTAAQGTSRLTSEMKEQSKQLLTLLGIPVIQAPSEGEAQCSHLCKTDKVFATASQDADALLFGTKRLVRYLNMTGKRKVPRKNIYMDIKPEIIILKELLEASKLTQDQLIIVGMLIGTDFNPGIHGYGPKKALKLVKQEKTLQAVLEKVEWSGTSAETVFNFFKFPPANDFDIEFSTPKKEKIISMLVDKYEFSFERIEKALQEVTKKQNTGLGRFLK